MATSEARINANRSNGALSKGPTTPEGKEKSRANSLKHGLTGAGVVVPEGAAAELERKSAAYARELNAQGEVGLDLARRAALNMLRMNRCVDQQGAALAARVRQAEADFVPPEGLDEAEAAGLRAEAGRIAMFDPSKEATLVRKYEAAAERAYFRCLKELRQMQRPARVASPAPTVEDFEEMMGSFFPPTEADDLSEEEYAAMYKELGIPLPRGPIQSSPIAQAKGRADIPISAGRRR